MRVGLFATGAVVAIIGVGVLLASLTLSSGPTTTQFDSVEVAGLLGHSFYARELNGVSETSANTHFSWVSTQSFFVAVYPSVSCSQDKGVCPGPNALQVWWGEAGNWAVSGSLPFPLFLNISNPNGTPGSFSGSLQETYTTGSGANPTWGLWGIFLPLIGAIVLILIGGVGVFLGLFLRGGVYSGVPPGGPPYDDFDDDDLGDEDDLDPLGEDDEPPPKGAT